MYFVCWNQYRIERIPKLNWNKSSLQRNPFQFSTALLFTWQDAFLLDSIVHYYFLLNGSFNKCSHVIHPYTHIHKYIWDRGQRKMLEVWNFALFYRFMQKTPNHCSVLQLNILVESSRTLDIYCCYIDLFAWQ